MAQRYSFEEIAHIVSVAVLAPLSLYSVQHDIQL